MSQSPEEIARYLNYYKRADVREAMAAQCAGKEIAVSYGGSFGKRPQIIQYPGDILSHAQRKATSFHVSEETWSNPIQLDTGMRRKELDELRVGWDLVLDIDFPVWEATKKITYALIEQLRTEGVPDEAITAKFSGNKGFHIAVPFEAFPDTYLTDDGTEILMSDLFPEGVKTIVEYLVHAVDGPDNDFSLSERLVDTLGLDALKDMLITVDVETGEQVAAQAQGEGNEFVCPSCGWRGRSEEEYLQCPSQSCNRLLTPVTGSAEDAETREKVDLAIDTMLVSSRHMYRLVYSLHEKSGLASIPVPLEQVRSFEKRAAEPSNVSTDGVFLSRSVERGCASGLLNSAMAFSPPGEEEKKSFEEVEWVGDAAPEEAFPPPIKKMLSGLRDGRKRALFVLTNFLRSVGWSHEMIEARLREWNEEHPEPLRESTIEGHLRYHKDREPVLPPNFDNDMYYKNLGVLEHDELSRRVKNPVQYVRLKLKQGKKD